MPDVVEPTPTPPGATPDPVPASDRPNPSSPVTTNSTGLPSNVAAALACFPLIGGIVFWFLEKSDSFVRFYAWQSIIFGLAWIIFDIISKIMFAVFGSIPAIGTLFVFIWAIIAAVVHIAFVVVWIIATVKAFSGSRWEMPYIGPMARKQTGDL